MKRHIVGVTGALIALVALIGFNLLTPGVALAQANHDCVQISTIDALEACVKHAASQGIITDRGVTRSLLAKLDAAEKDLKQGDTTNAIDQLKAFIDEVQAESGKHIDAAHVQQMVMRVQMMIPSLQNG